MKSNKKNDKKESATQQLLNLKQFVPLQIGDNGAVAIEGEDGMLYTYIMLRPDNISVLGRSEVLAKIRNLQNILSDVAELQMIINGLLSERIQTLLKYATTSLEPEQESKLIEEITSAINHIKMENEQIAHHRQELEKAMRDIEQHDLEVAQKQELKEIQGHHFGGLSI